MAVRTHAQVIEVFHLLFLRVLAASRQDWFVLKGGANLRYFFASPRYSNDIDLDFFGREAWQVGDAVDGVLHGKPLEMLTRQAQIRIGESSALKQTDTTRRWKVGLVAEGHTGSIRTKIEFSGRNGGGADVSLEAVPDVIVDPYGVLAPSILHYGETAAIQQKLAALALRNEAKARDVFDLDLLLRRRRAVGSSASPLSTPYAAEGALRAREISYPSFQSEVVPFLEPDFAVLYDELTWGKVCSKVSSSLEEIAATTGERL